MFLPCNGLFCLIYLLYVSVVAQRNESTSVSAGVGSLDLTASQPLPLVRQRGYEFSGFYDPASPWSPADDGVRALLNNAYHSVFSSKNTEQALQSGATYSAFQGTKAEYFISLEALYSGGVQATWQEVLVCLAILKDDILVHQWAQVRNSLFTTHVVFNRGPLIVLIIGRSQGDRKILRPPGRLMADGMKYGSRRMSFPSALECVSKIIYELRSQEIRHGPLAILQSFSRVQEVGLVTMSVKFANLMGDWPTFTSSDMIELLQLFWRLLREVGRALGCGFEIYYRQGHNSVLVGNIQMTQEYSPPLQAVLNASTVMGNVTKTDAENSENFTANSYPNGNGEYNNQDDEAGPEHDTVPWRNGLNSSRNVVEIS